MTRSLPALLLALVALGALALLANRRQPLVRNGLVYASASEHVIQHGYDPRPVVADSKLSYDKPILYAWLSAPFVGWLGSHDGLRLTSFLGTLAYLLAALSFARSFRSFLPKNGPAAVLWFSALGPCVVYQFWSAHPDGWFAALVVASWGLAQRIVEEPAIRTGPRLALLGGLIYLAILFKNYGLVLLLSCPLYLALHWRKLRTGARSFPGLIAIAVAVFGLIGMLVLLAWTGHHPLSRLEGEGGGVGQYGQGILWRSAKGTWIQLGLSLLLQFQVALLLALKRDASTRELWKPLLCFAGIYVAGLMPFPTTFYNMRYFLPLFPLVALVLARGAAELAPLPRRLLLLAHGGLALLLTAVFNWEPAYRAAAPAIPALEVTWIGPRLSLLDNLRMKLHLDQKELLDHIDREIPAGATLYMLDANYYGDAQQGVFERAGLIRPDIRVRYASGRSFRPEEPSFFLWCSRSPPPGLQGLGQVTDLGRSLYRIEGG